MLQVFQQIPPCGIHSSDQLLFLLSIPPFELFFTSNCIKRGRIVLIIDESIQVIPGHEAFRVPFPNVFEKSPLQVACHADVQHLRVVRKDVNIKCPHSRKAVAELILRQAQDDGILEVRFFARALGYPRFDTPAFCELTSSNESCEPLAF